MSEIYDFKSRCQILDEEKKYTFSDYEILIEKMKAFHEMKMKKADSTNKESVDRAIKEFNDEQDFLALLCSRLMRELAISSKGDNNSNKVFQYGMKEMYDYYDRSR